MKGFKSFADPTTLEFGPGVTVVVGPNGSGKSNVVDAIAWVLGAQGPSVVRSQKMDDVIFAGTSKRPALGRAEVILVLDNASRRLPIDLNEVTISRTLFRSGDSEYALNGVECRLLDVQELLSDSGVGRQQHSLVGQGQLDSVLQARPEDRRMIIEEAAGILKFRRRRERSVRRLEAAEESLLRLGDLLREVRRQLRPLERQAESAARHDALERRAPGGLALPLGPRTLRARREDLRWGAPLWRSREQSPSGSRRARGSSTARSGSSPRTSSGPIRPTALAATIARLERLDERARDSRRSSSSDAADGDADRRARRRAGRRRTGGALGRAPLRSRGCQRDRRGSRARGEAEALAAEETALESEEAALRRAVPRRRRDGAAQRLRSRAQRLPNDATRCRWPTPTPGERSRTPRRSRARRDDRRRQRGRDTPRFERARAATRGRCRTPQRSRESG